MDKIFSDETLRKALSLNLIKLPDGINNIYELKNNHRNNLTIELIQKLKKVQKTETLINTMDIYITNIKYYIIEIVYTVLELIFIFTFSALISFDAIDKKLGIILVTILSISLVINTIISITKTLRNHFKMIRKQVAQGTLMVDELYQRQFNNN